jgi:hypothetical protein
LNWLAAGVLGLWLALVLLLGANGAFVQPPGAPPLPILLGATVPMFLFLAAYWGSAAFREWVLGADLRLLTAIHGWRFVGLGFLALYAHGVLPGLFALPAGWGDIAIGVTAPWVMLALLHPPASGSPAFATSRLFVVWNLLGILDLVNGMILGALGSGLIPGLVGSVTTGPMAQWPLVLVPAYVVPFLFMLHLAALFQVRQQTQAERSGRRPDQPLRLAGAASPD